MLASATLASSHKLASSSDSVRCLQDSTSSAGTVQSAKTVGKAKIVEEAPAAPPAFDADEVKMLFAKSEQQASELATKSAIIESKEMALQQATEKLALVGAEMNQHKLESQVLSIALP